MSVRAVGWIALGALAIHGGNHVRLGTPTDLLWACNVATAILAIGCLIENARLVAVAVMWLCFGTPMWVLDIVTGGVVMSTSFLTHIGALGIGLVGMRKLGVPKHTWAIAAGALIALMLLCRLASPAALNINLAHAVWAGWEATFPRYDMYFAVVVTAFSITFFVIERLFQALMPRAHRVAG